MAYLRSRTGCWTCRFRKKKCDENGPICNQCKTLNIYCENTSEDQPLYMRDAAAALRKKQEIKMQMGKCKRKRKRKSAKLREHQLPQSQQDGAPATRPPIKLPVMPTEHPRNIPPGDLAIYDGIPGPMATAPRYILPYEEKAPKQVVECHFEHEEIGAASLPLLTLKKNGGQKRLSSRIEILVQTEQVPTDEYICIPEESFGNFEVTSRIIKNDERVTKFLQTDFDAISQISPSEAELYTSMLSLKSLRELRLIQHYIYDVCRYTYKGMPKESLDQLMRQALIPRCKSTNSFRQGCLSSGALHLMAVNNDPKLKVEAIAYRNNTLVGLREHIAGPRGQYSEDVLGTIMILATFDINNASSDWLFHLNAAIDCIVHLNVLNRHTLTVGLSFLTRRVLWLDILSSCTTGLKPKLWANYRYILTLPHNRLNALKLYEIVGCHDIVLYLISEVHCLEEYYTLGIKNKSVNWEVGKRRAIELDGYLERAQPREFRSTKCRFNDDGSYDYTSIRSSSSSSGASSQSPYSPAPTNMPSPTSSEGECDLKVGTVIHLACNNYGAVSNAITAAFIAAARIHMWSIGVGFYPRLDIFEHFLSELITAIKNVPDDHVRCIIYPLLIGGSLATSACQRNFFRRWFGMAEPCGILRRVHDICDEVWRQRDEIEAEFGIEGAKEVHWRSIIRDNEYYYILYV